MRNTCFFLFVEGAIFFLGGGNCTEESGATNRNLYVPHEEDDLGAASIGSGVVVELEHTITAVISGELSQEVGVRSRGLSSLQDGDALVVAGKTEDHVSVLSAQLEVVELRDDGLVDSNSGRLEGASRKLNKWRNWPNNWRKGNDRRKARRGTSPKRGTATIFPKSARRQGEKCRQRGKSEVRDCRRVKKASANCASPGCGDGRSVGCFLAQSRRDRALRSKDR